MKLYDAEGFRAWASMLVNNKDCYSFPEIDAQINFFGNQGDSAYLVINVHTSETSSTEYIFLTEKPEDKEQRIIFIFDFLKTVNYSFRQLLAWLEKAEYIDHEMGERIAIGGLIIKREFATFSENAKEMEQ